MLSAYLLAHGIPCRWVGTKADKLSAVERAAAAARFEGFDGSRKDAAPLLVSAKTHEGIDRLWRDIRTSFSA
jgi:GTP-binding protein EngB required for normal cell division